MNFSILGLYIEVTMCCFTSGENLNKKNVKHNKKHMRIRVIVAQSGSYDETVVSAHSHCPKLTDLTTLKL